MRALITGGAGFIGSHLCDALLAHGWDVVVIDNFITGSRENVRHLDGDRRFELIECDVELAPRVACDAVFHLASPASPVGYGEHPFETLRTNSQGTWRALEIASENHAKFLLASTSEVYGDPLEHPQPETYFGNVDPIGPRSCYDEGKRFGEALTMTYVRETDLDARIVRIFNCYGPRNALDDGRMVPTFAVQALKGEPLTVYGDGSQTRSLCYVDDMVDGLMAAMSCSDRAMSHSAGPSHGGAGAMSHSAGPSHGGAGAMRREGTPGGVFNLGQPREHTVLEFAKLIIKMAGSQSPIEHLPMRDGEIERRKPDARHAQEVLGWTAKRTLEQGLDRTIAWYRRQLEAAAIAAR